ncbi:MAG: sulfite exporter TauE/SafE family protein [Rhodocyclaceae bacterium]|nr:sulfite exporter TauE/SafE family protein [Rhodocyclaceae bacterium]
MSPDPALIAALLGGVVGLVLALSGAGGGIIAVPLLVFGLHLPMIEAAPVGLIAVGLAAMLGAGLGLRDGIVRYRAATLIGSIGMLAAPIGVWLAEHIPNSPLLIAFAAVLVVTGLRSWRRARQPAGESARVHRPLPCHVDPTAGRLHWTAPCARALAAVGLLSGTLSGLLGVGGGFVIVPALQRHTDLDSRSILATSLAVIALVSIGGIVAAGLHGRIDWPTALPFAGGAALALLAGRLVAGRLQGHRLDQAFALVCFGVALLMLGRGSGLIDYAG